MKTICVLQCGAMLSLALFFSGASGADNCSGYDALVNKSSETIEVTKGHALTSVSYYSIVTTDDAPIFNGTTGECSGTTLTTPDGKSKTWGYCARKDKDGDTYSIEWQTSSDSEKGTWKWRGGTGKFADKANNSGWSQPVVADGKMLMVKWGGTCK